VKSSSGCDSVRVCRGVCSFCRKRRGHLARAAHLRPSFKSRMPECQSDDAGATPADRTIFHTLTTRRAPACAAWSPKPCGLGAAPRRRKGIAGVGGRASRDAVPLSKKSRGSQVGRQRPHKPRMSGFDSRPRNQSWAARSFRRSLASQAGEHGAKPWRSTISKCVVWARVSPHVCKTCVHGL
jgi:hypothetical protein